MNVQITNRPVGEEQPTFVLAEAGINHNGDLDIAKKLIDVAVIAGCDAVKFQKRTPELCVPAEQRDVMRETPWGLMTYLEYRHRVEFGEDEYREIDDYCRSKGILWFASCWDCVARTRGLCTGLRACASDTCRSASTSSPPCP